MIVTSDSYELFEQYEKKKEKELEQFPVCDICKEPIQGEHLYLIHDEFICETCMTKFFKKWTDDFIL